jgi:succinate-acetate transporter protein
MLVKQKVNNNNIDNLDYLNIPIINIRKISIMPISPINTFALSISLFMLSLTLLEWIDFRSPAFSTSLILGGICEYIMGIFNWYNGKAILYFINIIFGLMHLLIYYTYEIAKYQIRVNEHFESYLIGTFFAIYLVILLSLLYACKQKGFLYIINLGMLILSDIFIITWQYLFNKDNSYKNDAKKTAGFFLFLASLTIWFNGVGNLLNDLFHSEYVPMMKPRL